MARANEVLDVGRNRTRDTILENREEGIPVGNALADCLCFQPLDNGGSSDRATRWSMGGLPAPVTP
jgi:hypothetical protein